MRLPTHASFASLRLCIQHIFVAKIEFEKKKNEKRNEKNTLEKYIGKIFKISSRQ